MMPRLEWLTEGDARMSVVSQAELSAGVEMAAANRRLNGQALALLVQRILVLAFDVAAAWQYSVLRAALRDRNRHVMDCLIAAHAIDATLVTSNEADFAGCADLVVENWDAGA